MHILVIEPGKHPYEKEISNTLEAMHEVVGGYIETVYPFSDVVLICDEEAKLKSDNNWNRILPEISDIIKGTFFICCLGDEDLTDITAELVEKYTKRFWNIEYFIPTPNGLLPIVLNER